MWFVGLPDVPSWASVPGDCWLADLRGVCLALARAGLPAWVAFAAFRRAPGGSWLGPRPKKAQIAWAFVGATLPTPGPGPSPGLLGSSSTAPSSGPLGASSQGPWAWTATPGSWPTQGAGKPCCPAGNRVPLPRRAPCRSSTCKSPPGPTGASSWARGLAGPGGFGTSESKEPIRRLGSEPLGRPGGTRTGALRTRAPSCVSGDLQPGRQRWT